MAFGERWNSVWKPLGQAVTYTIRIKEDGYVGGTSSITNLGNEPLSFRNRGNEIFSIGTVIGSEIEFRFWITSADGTDFDDLLTATERQFLIEIERDSVSYFVGFMKPENISKTFVEYQYELSLSATDGLAYLKEVPFRTSTGNNYTDRVNFLTTLKRALEFTGHELDIKVKLGTYESSAGALMTSTECALDKANSDSERFYRNEDGILNPDNCQEVISQVIGIFNCSIRQLDGAWYIYNNVEINSFLFTFDWATLTQQSRVAHNPVVAIDTYEYKTMGEVSFRPPLSKVEITFQNKFVPDNVILNGDFSSGLTNWTNGSNPNDWSTFTVISEELNCAIASGTMTDEKEFTSDTVILNQLAGTDKLVLSVRAIIDTLVEDQGEAPYLSALITGPTGTRTVDLGQMSEEWKLHEAISNPLMLGDGNYSVTIIVDHQDLTISDLDVRFDDVEMYVDFGDVAVTVDKLITIFNDNAIDEKTEEYLTKIGDSLELNDQGSIKIGTTLTSEWSTFGNTEDEPIVDLLGAFQLNARQAPTKYTRLSISDLNDTISSGTIITVNSVPYRTIRFNKIYRDMTVDVDLLEINTA
jgi:hypothetical protein